MLTDMKDKIISVFRCLPRVISNGIKQLDVTGGGSGWAGREKKKKKKASSAYEKL